MSATQGTWVLAGPRAALPTLRPLVRAHERLRPVRVIELESPTATVSAEQLVDADGLLLVGDRRRAPSTVLPGPFLQDATGRAVPSGWVPDVGLERFAAAAARVLRRGGGVPGPLALLGQWNERYQRLAGRMEANLESSGELPFAVLRWTSERIARDDLVRALRLGLGVGIYFGHGRPSGWAGYHGLRAAHLTAVAGEPLGALLSVTCLTANRRRLGLSFSEEVVTGGVAACAVGAVAPVSHLENMRWMLGLAAAMRAGEIRLGAALLAAAPAGASTRSAYRILGDPLAPLVGTLEGARRAARVWAPAADEDLSQRQLEPA